MMFIENVHKAQAMVDLGQPLAGVTVILMGGASTIKEQPLHLLDQRGVVTAAINNAARHFRPDYWFSADNPNAFDPRILMDPTIQKFGAGSHMKGTIDKLDGKPYHACPRTLFYLQKEHLPLFETLSPRLEVPWFRNTLFVAISILYNLGCRSIILGGSDFDFSPTGSVYAHDAKLSDKERELNRNIYSKLAADLLAMHPIFSGAGLILRDCSANSKLGEAYEVLSMEAAVDLCLQTLPADFCPAEELQHGTRFADDNMKEMLGITPDPWADMDEC